MANPIVLASKIKMKRSSMGSIEEEIAKLNAKREEIENQIEDAENEEELDDVEAVIGNIEEELSEKEEEKKALEEEISQLETELEELNNKKPSGENPDTQEGERAMDKEKIKEIRSGINNYVKSKGVQRAFTSVEGGALIPEELLSPKKADEDKLNLKNYVNVVPVTSGSGKYPYLKRSNSRMTSVAELAENPELANPEIEDVSWDIETYRGYIPISQEMIDDADYDVVDLIAEELEDQELNTSNDEILAQMKGMPALDAANLDDIKAVFNKEIKTVYAPKAFMSASLFNELDLMKDENGRYLLQDDITVESGKKIKGKEVVVVDDEVIGEAEGDLVGFLGDAKKAVSFFDRKRASVKWIDHHVYGELLAIFVRFDVAITDEEAGYYVTFTPEVAGA